ncbi:MAG: SAM-dependent methyltransferase [Planctomyces sp.]|nr:SAM-dependent methyltransferase [Planctomyces sp.]MBA4120717.1 SAM-dependent methyltransferase [Isosphaera sp.]
MQTTTTRRRPVQVPTARTADRYALYMAAVQEPEAEVRFIDRVYRGLNGRRAVSLREDFCGTFGICCAWATSGGAGLERTALGVDLDPEPIAWGVAHHLGALDEPARARVGVLQADVLSERVRRAGPAGGFDAIAAFNFSYWVLMERALLLRYLRACRGSLARGGALFLDAFGGPDAHRELTESRRCKGFTYVWNQERYNAIDGVMRCSIGFRFRDGTELPRAFRYTWRLWTLPEIADMLREAGFGSVDVYWEGDDGKGGGDGVFRKARFGDAGNAFICYIVAHDGPADRPAD